MGLFDSVIVKCPRCGADCEFQSKSGDCVLRRYNVDDVPMRIAADIDGEDFSCNCGLRFKLRLAPPVSSRLQVVIDDS
jgi:hypothetical protein